MRQPKNHLISDNFKSREFLIQDGQTLLLYTYIKRPKKIWWYIQRHHIYVQRTHMYIYIYIWVLWTLWPSHWPPTGPTRIVEEENKWKKGFSSSWTISFSCQRIKKPRDRFPFLAGSKWILRECFMCRPANVKALSAFKTSNGQKYLSEVLIEKKATHRRWTYSGWFRYDSSYTLHLCFVNGWLTTKI